MVAVLEELESMEVRTLVYSGEEYTVPLNHAELGYTHGVFGKHMYRGALCLRWQKKTVSRERVIEGIKQLYGEAVSDIEFIAIDE